MGDVNPPKHGTALAELPGGKVSHHHSGALGGER
jgi:hypothetical protein